MIQGRKRCQHCNKAAASRPRGLCWRCSFTPGVKEQYPTTSKYARRGLSNPNSEGRIPAEPTSFKCGSEEKMLVMSMRLMRGELPHHPDDNKEMVNRPKLKKFPVRKKSQKEVSEEVIRRRKLARACMIRYRLKQKEKARKHNELLHALGG